MCRALLCAPISGRGRKALEGRTLRSLRIASHGLVLLFVDMAGIFLGFAVYKLLGTGRQLAVQLPIAVILSIGLYLAWIGTLRAMGLRKWLAHGLNESAGCWIAALIWNPLVLIPLHYVTQGYVTSVANLTAMAMYQAPVNLIALLGAWHIQRQLPT